jgi:mannose-6-phosphate isomerase
VSLLLNHVVLNPGEAIYLGAGSLHSYLRGVGIEVMANSDNVVRGGLTEKQVDVPELLSIVDTSPLVPAVQRSTSRSRSHAYLTPVPEFSLTRFVVDGTCEVASPGPEIVMVTEGSLLVVDAGRVATSSGPADVRQWQRR